MHKQAIKIGTRIQEEFAKIVDLSQKPFRIILNDDKQALCNRLITATGSKPKKISGLLYFGIFHREIHRNFLINRIF
jgi:thioredoxin reductase